MTQFISINPATEEVIETFPEDDHSAVIQQLLAADAAFTTWRVQSFAERAAPMRRLAGILQEHRSSFAHFISEEMGRPHAAAFSEIEKCAFVCDYYAENAEKMLAEERSDVDGKVACVWFEPLGVVLAIMPWNYPFWQVIRAATPAIMAGNVVLLKHAPNVQRCARALEWLFLHAGFPRGVFQNVRVSEERVPGLIQDQRVKAVTLTGSVHAGSAVASIAAREIKKAVLELGGSDPFIVLDDAQLHLAARNGASMRLMNAGQSCVAAKRFIVVRGVAERFTELLAHEFGKVIMGDPMWEKTTLGPLASQGGRDVIAWQVDESVRRGATIVMGGVRPSGRGFFYPPTILANVTKGMPVFDEETFGPVAPIITVADEEEAIRVANDTRFGLGASIWSWDVEKAKTLAGRINAGFVAINAGPKSDPRLPFGGINKSGYGRELGTYGLKEFVNIKTVTSPV